MVLAPDSDDAHLLGHYMAGDTSTIGYLVGSAFYEMKSSGARPPSLKIQKVIARRVLNELKAKKLEAEREEKKVLIGSTYPTQSKLTS